MGKVFIAAEVPSGHVVVVETPFARDEAQALVDAPPSGYMQHIVEGATTLVEAERATPCPACQTGSRTLRG